MSVKGVQNVVEENGVFYKVYPSGGRKRLCIHKAVSTTCKECGGGSVCVHNKIRSQCRDCKGGGRCEHNRLRYYCRECKGNGICEHNIEKYRCKECKGGGICEHNVEKYRCKDCKGKGICEHNVRKTFCKDCKGGGICEHNRIRSRCKMCKGGSICEHNRIKYYCQDCKGNGICSHNRTRSKCKECNGGSVCIHSNIRSQCKECNGGSFCEHNKIRSRCRECNGGSFCEHNKIRCICKICKGTSICSCGKVKHECWKHCICPCGTLNIDCPKKHRNIFCTLCKINIISSPRRRIEDINKRVCCDCESRCYNDKLRRIELEYVYKLKTWGYYPTEHDKTIRDSLCRIITEHNSTIQNRKRVDLYFRTEDSFHYDIILEIDENSHSGYDISCEFSRLEDLHDQVVSNTGKVRPLCVIRFNPFSKQKDLDERLKKILKKAFDGGYSVDDARGFSVVELLGYSRKRKAEYENSMVAKRQEV